MKTFKDLRTVQEQASPMIKPPTNEFGKKEDAFAHAKKHGGKVMKKTFTHPTSGMKTVSYVVKEEAELDEASLPELIQMLREGISYSYGFVPGRKKPNATTRHLRDYPVSDKDVAKPVKKPEKKKPEQGVAEASSLAQQAAIAIAMKKAGKKPKNVSEETLEEAEKNGKKVQLNKPFRTSDGKGKFAVYTKNDKGNVVKVNFGDTTGLTIKTSNPDRRRNFRARHNCDTPGPKHKARYWSCKAWSRGTVSAGLGT